jgi:hypothetical protein
VYDLAHAYRQDQQTEPLTQQVTFRLNKATLSSIKMEARRMSYLEADERQERLTRLGWPGVTVPEQRR